MLIKTTLIILSVFVVIFGVIAGIDIYKSVSKKNGTTKFNKKVSLSAYFMLTPAVILAFIFIMLPILFSLILLIVVNLTCIILVLTKV